MAVLCKFLGDFWAFWERYGFSSGTERVLMTVSLKADLTISDLIENVEKLRVLV